MLLHCRNLQIIKRDLRIAGHIHPNLKVGSYPVTLKIAVTQVSWNNFHNFNNLRKTRNLKTKETQQTQKTES